MSDGSDQSDRSDGSDKAACDLGDWYGVGAFGLPKDHAQAAYWYERVASAPHKHLKESFVAEAAMRLRELRAGQ